MAHGHSLLVKFRRLIDQRMKNVWLGLGNKVLGLMRGNITRSGLKSVYVIQVIKHL